MNQFPVLRKITKINSLTIFLITLLFYNWICMFYLNANVVFTKYPHAADQFLSHSLTNERFLDFSPAYLGLHILFKKLFANWYAAVIFFQILLTSFSAVLLYKLSRLYISSTFSFLCALLFAFNKSIISYTFTLEPETLLIFLVLAFVYFLCLNEPKLILAGSFYSLSLLARPSLLPLIIILPLLLIIHKRTIRQQYKILPFFYPLFFMLALIACMNFQNHKPLLTFPMSPGQTFYEGNNPISYGNSAAYPAVVYAYAQQFSDEADYQHVVYKDLARRVTEQNLDTNQASRYWTQLALNFISDHPLYHLKRCLLKTALLFHSHKRFDLESVYWNEENLLKTIPEIPFGIIGALAILGLLSSLKEYKKYFFIYAVILSQCALMIVLYVSERQRLMLIPFLLLFAVYYIQRYFSSPRRSLQPIFFFIILSVLFNIPAGVIRDEDVLIRNISKMEDYLYTAFINRKDNALSDARLNDSKALIYTPFMNEDIQLAGLFTKENTIADSALQLILANKGQIRISRFDMANLLLLNNNYDEAEKIFLKLSLDHSKYNRLFFQSSYPDFYLAKIDILHHNNSSAVLRLRSVLEQNPGEPWALASLYTLNHETKLKDDLFRYFHPVDAHMYLGKAYLDLKDFHNAYNEFLEVFKILPTYKKNLIYLAYTAGNLGMCKSSLNFLYDAFRLDSNYIFKQEELRNIVEHCEKLQPKDNSFLNKITYIKSILN